MFPLLHESVSLVQIVLVEKTRELRGKTEDVDGVDVGQVLLKGSTPLRDGLRLKVARHLLGRKADVGEEGWVEFFEGRVKVVKVGVAPVDRRL